MPPSLKIFLLALAIIDDLGAIIVIALFYSGALSAMSLGLAALGLLVLWGMNRRNVLSVWPYIIVGLFVWLCVLKSGVHATIAGVATALMIPLADQRAPTERPLEELEHALVPWVSFAILPIFAFANAGVSLHGLTPASLLAPVPLAIALGLFIGKADRHFWFCDDRYPRRAIATCRRAPTALSCSESRCLAASALR